MTDLNRPNSSNLDAITSGTGTVVSANRDGTPATYGVTLAANTTYFFPMGAAHGPVPAEVGLGSTHIKWDNAIIVTWTFETSNFAANPQNQDPRGIADVSDFDTTAGNWMQENPTSNVYVSGSGSGGLTATGLTLVVAGGTAGGSTIHLGNFATRRGRWRATVGATGGKVRVGVHGKER